MIYDNNDKVHCSVMGEFPMKFQQSDQYKTNILFKHGIAAG